MKKQHVQLSEKDRQYLESLLATGELSVKLYRRALALLELDRGKTYTACQFSPDMGPPIFGQSGPLAEMAHGKLLLRNW